MTLDDVASLRRQRNFRKRGCRVVCVGNQNVWHLIFCGPKTGAAKKKTRSVSVSLPDCARRHDKDITGVGSYVTTNRRVK